MTGCMNAVIFAGGKSSRMGKDKALIPFGNEKTLAQFQYNRLNRLFHKVYISAKENKFDFECIVIEDLYQEHSPLVGLISIFETLQAEKVFILSVDAPFVESDTIEKILSCNEKDLDVIVAKSPSGVQPLCGLYKRSILPLARQQLEKNNHRLSSLLDLSHTLYVQFDEDKPFTNLNHPEEYRQALKNF